MAVQLGTATVLKIGSATLAFGTSTAFSRNANMVDVTNKDSSGNQEVLPGMRSGTFSFEGIFAESISSTTGFDLLLDAQTAGTSVTAKFGTATTGDKTYSFSCYVSGLTRTAPSLDKETFSCTLTQTGAITEATNS